MFASAAAKPQSAVKRRSSALAKSWIKALLAVQCCAALTAGAADRGHTLNVYAWPDYFPPALIAKFQAETGIHVNYAVFDDPAMAETTLSVGNSNYDIVTMNASPELGREIPSGFWLQLDQARIPNARNADPLTMRLLQAVDPGNRHAVPWMWGTTGLIYNADKINALMPNAPVGSLDMVLKKEIAAKFAGCGISVLDSWGDILPMVARYLGQAQLTDDRRSLDAVMAKLREIKPYIRRISSSGYYEQLADGELCLSIGYSGDAIIARRMAQDGHANVHLAYSFARESVPFWIDSLVIPADSPNPDGAFAFINFVMRPEISAEVTRFIGFATGNAAALPLLEPAVRDNAIIYPPASVRERFTLEKVYTPDETRNFVRAWQRFKATE
jgi:putrescine transport system substrate-binding protein